MCIVMFKSKRFPKWLCGFAGIVFILGMASVFRGMNNVTDMLHTFLNTFMLLPLFFIFLAIALYRFKGKAKEKPLAHKKKKKSGRKDRKFFNKTTKKGQKPKRKKP